MKTKKYNLSGRIKIYPNQAQIIGLNNCFGQRRFVWNWILATKEELYKQYKETELYQKEKATGKKSFTPDEWEQWREFNPNKYGLGMLFTQYKKDNPDKDWLKEISIGNHRTTIQSAWLAFEAFFKRYKDGVGHPKFKSKYDDTKSAAWEAAVNNRGIKIEDNHLILPVFYKKFGGIKVSKKARKPVNTYIKKATITKTPSGDYYVGIQYEREIPQYTDNKKKIGGDLSLTKKSSFTYTDGENMYYLNKDLNNIERLNRRIEVLSRKMSNKKGSKKGEDKSYAYRKLNRARNRTYESKHNIIVDNIHRHTKHMVDNFSTIKLEDMAINIVIEKDKRVHKRLTQYQNDTLLGEIKRQIDYKTEIYNRKQQIVDPEYTTKMCFNCKTINDWVEIHHRIWTCDTCGDTHDQDENAAKNILKAKPIKA